MPRDNTRHVPWHHTSSLPMDGSRPSIDGLMRNEKISPQQLKLINCVRHKKTKHVYSQFYFIISAILSWTSHRNEKNKAFGSCICTCPIVCTLHHLQPQLNLAFNTSNNSRSPCTAGVATVQLVPTKQNSFFCDKKDKCPLTPTRTRANNKDAFVMELLLLLSILQYPGLTSDSPYEGTLFAFPASSNNIPVRELVFAYVR